ncbi:hypothetical protein HDU99_003185, partial [Rhizoclosmatium hyalinum]
MTTHASSTVHNKVLSNITLGIVGSFCYISGLKYDGAYVTDYPEAFNASSIDFRGTSGSEYLMSAAIQAAVSVVNTHSDLLPFNYVNIK